MMHKKFYILLTIVFIIATFFRLYNLGITPPGLYPDEAMNGNNALEVLHTGDVKVFYPENNGREGLFINIQAMFLSLFGNEPWVLRLVSALFGIFTVVGIYFFVWALLRRYRYALAIAFSSAFFVAISFWHINFSRIGFRAIMAPFFLVWALYLLVETFYQTKRKSNAGSQIISRDQNTDHFSLFALCLSALAGLVYGLGMHSYIAYRATPLLIIIAFFFFKKYFDVSWKRAFGIFVVFVVGALIAFSPLALYFAQNPQDFLGRTTQVSVSSSSTPLKDLGSNIVKTLGMFHVRGDGNWRHNYAGAPQLFWPVGILFLWGLGESIIRRIWKKHEQSLNIAMWISFWWILVGLLPVVISNEGLPHALRAILVIPPVFMIAGIGLVYAYEHISALVKKRAPLLVFGIVGACVLVAQAYVVYFVAWADHPHVQDAFSSKYVDIGRELNEINSGIKKYVVVNTGGVDVRGVAMPSQTVMFITDTFRKEEQEQKNIHYISSENQIPLLGDGVVFYLEAK